MQQILATVNMKSFLVKSIKFGLQHVYSIDIDVVHTISHMPVPFFNDSHMFFHNGGISASCHYMATLYF